MFNVIQTETGRVFICVDEKLDAVKEGLVDSGERIQEIARADDIEIVSDLVLRKY